MMNISYYLLPAHSAYSARRAQICNPDASPACVRNIRPLPESLIIFKIRFWRFILRVYFFRFFFFPSIGFLFSRNYLVLFIRNIFLFRFRDRYRIIRYLRNIFRDRRRVFVFIFAGGFGKVGFSKFIFFRRFFKFRFCSVLAVLKKLRRYLSFARKFVKPYHITVFVFA